MYDMDSSTIANFLREYKKCPRCHLPLTITAEDRNISNIHFTVRKERDNLIIKGISSYFVSERERDFSFAISIVDGHVIQSDRVSQFISLYELDMTVSKKCESQVCNNESKQMPDVFVRSIRLYYDRLESTFVAEPEMEAFSFIFDNTYFYFINDYRISNSFLYHHSLSNTARCREGWAGVPQRVPYIPISKFNFIDNNTLFSKINSIRLLA